MDIEQGVFLTSSTSHNSFITHTHTHTHTHRNAYTVRTAFALPQRLESNRQTERQTDRKTERQVGR